MLRWALVFFAAGLTVAHVTGRLFQPVVWAQGEVVVEHNAELRETDYRIVVQDCRITWTVYSSEVNSGVIRHRSDCALSLGEQAPLIAEVLRKVLEVQGEAAPFRTLSWGRLFPDGSRDSTMAARLAVAAKRSPHWDSARGRPRNGDVNGSVRTLANDAGIYEELRPVFAQAGLELRLSSVEKVLILPAGQLPFFERLRNSGVRPADRLPFDCQTWFSVRPIGTNKP